MNTITSRKHEDVKLVSSLHQANNRRAHGLFIAEGIRVVSSLIGSKIKLKQLYIVQETSQETVITLKKLCAEHGYNNTYLTIISQPVLEKISCTTSPSGILSVFYIPQQEPLANLTGGIVLADMSSPGNMGTMIRTAAALKTESIVIIDGVDVWSPKVVQATAGTLGLVTIFECTWSELIAAKKDLSLCALVVSGGQQPTDFNPQKTLLVVGNEAHGLPETWVDQCDKKITLPMPGNTESLNAALALSIVMYLGYLKSKDQPS
jgi:TrmH family RNA methyltransferase